MRSAPKPSAAFNERRLANRNNKASGTFEVVGRKIVMGHKKGDRFTVEATEGELQALVDSGHLVRVEPEPTPVVVAATPAEKKVKNG